MSLLIKPMAVLLYSASVTILLAGGVLLYLLLQPVDVLKDWSITLQGTSHYPGEVITIDSHYTKLRDVTGPVHRYIYCKNERGTYTRYKLNDDEANSPSGTHRSTGIIVRIPEHINVPTTCHIGILIEYKVNPLRTQPEFTQSNEFELVAPPTTATSSTPTPTTTTAPARSAALSATPNTSTSATSPTSRSSVQGSPTAPTVQPSTPVTSTSTPPQTSGIPLVTPVLNFVTGLLN